ncbi:MAG: 4-hydroxy-tetrahydrodipicolinate synthase [Desulfobacterales bacterium]|nr:4-hydroxy-tetrahydrodipicolinate synthase [Desulfobacterales bacterium]MCP4160977.1 4-hydroxy-tetrahydrodipicolinate synthase [Deltaproteobacteria bacterium]
MITGCYTALVTPFTGKTVDYDELTKLADFQIDSGITGILAVGTTGESPTLSWEEHNTIIEKISNKTKGKCLCIAGTGSNNTKECLLATGHAKDAGVDAVLLVDPYYNGPSSLEIRREYIEPVAEKYPDLDIIPYVIPGRTGAQLLPEDLAIISEKYSNVRCVKEATGDLENMEKTRKLCIDNYKIFSGDDALLFEMMKNKNIDASGVISVASNIVPASVTKLVRLMENKEYDEAKKLLDGLAPLFDITTVFTKEISKYGEVTVRARNPLGLKTLMAVLGMIKGGVRKPLGKMTKQGFDKVVNIAKEVQKNNPELLNPISEFFNVDIEEKLENSDKMTNLYYNEY